MIELFRLYGCAKRQVFNNRRSAIEEKMEMKAENSITTALEKLSTGVGQGRVLEQIDKRHRKQQRLTLFAMLEQLTLEEVAHFPVILYRQIEQNGKKQPARLRFHLSLWEDHEIFWQLLGDYVILAVNRVKDLVSDSLRGRMKVDCFAKVKGRIKYPDDIRESSRKTPVLWTRKHCRPILPASGGWQSGMTV